MAIHERIERVQGSTTDVVATIETIRTAIGSMDHSSNDVASAMENQRKVASEIAQNIDHAARETGTVKEALFLVTSAFNDVSDGSDGIISSIAEMESCVKTLKDESANFLEMVRTPWSLAACVAGVAFGATEPRSRPSLSRLLE